VQHQLSFKLQELPSSGRQWSLEIPRPLFEDPDFGKVDAPSGLCKDVRWKGAISAQNNLFLLQGAWQAELTRSCVRCTADFPLLMQGECERCFTLAKRADEEESDECEQLEPPGEVDLIDLLREELWLAWKPMVVCDEQCQGLCQQCGENLNRHECTCAEQDEDHPFAALKNIRFDS